jgi:hypothetical protein
MLHALDKLPIILNNQFDVDKKSIGKNKTKRSYLAKTTVKAKIMAANTKYPRSAATILLFTLAVYIQSQVHLCSPHTLHFAVTKCPFFSFVRGRIWRNSPRIDSTPCGQSTFSFRGCSSKKQNMIPTVRTGPETGMLNKI